jgi:hypothetical protein
MPIAQTLRKIDPVPTSMAPPEGSIPAGTTPDGKRQLYRLTRTMARAVPAYDTDGNRKWRVNRLTGEQVLPMNKPEIYQEHLLFYMETDGHGTDYMQMYTPPSDEELRARERELAIQNGIPAFIGAMLDKGLTPEKLAAWVEQGMPTGPAGAEPVAADQTDEPVEEEEEEEDWSRYPFMYGPGLWYLTSRHEAAVRAGEQKGFKGTGDDAAVAAEAYRQDEAEAKKAQRVVPDY